MAYDLLVTICFHKSNRSYPLYIYILNHVENQCAIDEHVLLVECNKFKNILDIMRFSCLNVTSQ